MDEELDQQVLNNTQYQEGSSLIDQGATQETNTAQQNLAGTQFSYQQQRQNAINSYQDALDQINFGMRQVGIQTRSGAAQRNLYDASGQLSGIGQGVASNAIEPLVRQTRTLGERQAQTLTAIDRGEQLAIQRAQAEIDAIPTKTAQQKYELKNQIIAKIQKTAEEQRKLDMETKKFNLDVAKAEASIPGTRSYQLKVRAEQQEKGRQYISTPAQRDALKRAGRNIIEIDGDAFALSAKEEADLRNIAARTSKSLRTGNGNGTDPNLKVTQADKNDYNLSVLGLKDYIVTSRDAGEGEVTREDAAAILAEKFPWMNISDIQKEIYSSYGDYYDSKRPAKKNIQGTNTLLQKYF